LKKRKEEFHATEAELVTLDAQRRQSASTDVSSDYAT
jgi:hypothetical protein